MRALFTRGAIFSLGFLAVSLCLYGSVYAQGERLPAEGAVLYDKHCSECHFSLEKTLKAGRGWQRIKSSIIWACRKNSLNRLTDDEIKAIADALAIPDE